MVLELAKKHEIMRLASMLQAQLGYDGITFQKSFRSHQLDSEEKRIQVIITLRERFSSQLLTYPG